MNATSSLKKSLVLEVLRLQGTDGCWSDFMCEPWPGQSTSWTTAYVTRQLKESFIDKAALPISHALQRGTQFLLAEEHENGGWGYNARTRVDCDSSANACLALEEYAQQRNIDRLLEFQRASGAFATFESRGLGDSWADESLEISCTTVRALLMFRPDAVTDKALVYLRAVACNRDAWKPYWWTSEVYGILEYVLLAQLTCDRVPDWMIEYLIEQCDCTDEPLWLAKSIRALELCGRLPHTRKKKALRALSEMWNGGVWANGNVLRYPDPGRRYESCEIVPVVPLSTGVFVSVSALNAVSFS